MQQSALIDWLLMPLSGLGEHHLASWAAWHGRAMVLGWGLAIPLGIVIARYWKIAPRQKWPDELDNPFWWRSHLVCQIGGFLVACLGLVIALRSVDGDWGAAGRVHALLGWTVMALGVVQILSGLFRGSKGGPADDTGHEPGDHYDMTARRLVFEYVHKYGGHGTALLGFAAIAMGLITADAPRWMAIVIVAWWASLLLAAVRWQRRGRCIDTYQAIWGPHDHHPGLRIPAIGIGVRRIGRADPDRQRDLSRDDR